MKILASVLVTVLLCSPLAAQDPAPQSPEAVVDEEIVVSAQRIEERLQDVPVSLVVVSGTELEERAVSDVQDLATEAPGLMVTGQSSSTGELALTIRGIGSNTFGLGTESTVGYYVDGIYMPRPQGFVNQFLDLERIEVLRGPQGTLWGRNSTGGAINVITRSPSPDFRGSLRLGYGELDGPANASDVRAGLSLSGALSDRVWARFSGSLTQVEDFTENVRLNETADNLDGYGVRAGLTFNPSDSTSILVRADVTDDDAHHNFNLKAGNVSSGSVLGTLTRFFGLTEPTDIHQIGANVAPLAAYEESGIALDINHIFGDGSTSLQSLTSFRELDSNRRADVDGTGLDFVINEGSFDVEWWSQELKLHGSSDRLDWIAGLYYFEEEGSTLVDTLTDFALFEVHFFASNPGLFLFNPTDFCSLGFFAPTFLCGPDYYGALAPFLSLSLPGTVSSGNFFSTQLETSSFAGYGQLDWRLNDRWTLTTGLRYTSDSKDHTQTTIDFLTLAPATLADSDDWDAVTPSLGLEFRPNDRTLLYGTVSTGFKSGGFNSISLQPSFDEETITSFEVGVKSSSQDRRVTWNAAAFHYDYDDLQVAVLFPDRSSVENAARATVNGLELDLRFRPNSRLTLELGASVLDDEFDEFFSQDPVQVALAQDALNAQGIFDPFALAIAAASVPTSDLSGNSLQRAPDLAYNAAVSYLFDVGRSGFVNVRGQYSYTDDFAFDPFGNFMQSSYGLFDAHVTYRAREGGWFLNLYGRNLGNEEYLTGELFARVTSSLQLWAPPQQVGLQLGFDF